MRGVLGERSDLVGLPDVRSKTFMGVDDERRRADWQGTRSDVDDPRQRLVDASEPRQQRADLVEIPQPAIREGERRQDRFRGFFVIGFARIVFPSLTMRRPCKPKATSWVRKSCSLPRVLITEIVGRSPVSLSR